MKLHLVAVLGLASIVTAAAIGCAAPSEDAAPGDDGAAEDDLTQRQLPGVVAVEIAEVRGFTQVLSSKTLGAPKKVKGIVTNIKKLKPTDPVPRCLERDTARLTFLDGAGKKLATVGSYCGGFGNIDFENGKPGYGVKFDAAAVDAARTGPLAVGDVLWGVTSIDIVRPSTQEKKTLGPDQVGGVLGGIDLDQIPDANASFPRCLPGYSVSFKRANADLGYTSFICGSTTAADAPASLKAQFSGRSPQVSGGITLDPRPVIKALETKR